jgi:pimeloyl-ACP methyl ester carboxylesterase
MTSAAASLNNSPGKRPDLVGGLVLSPPLPGAGARVLQPAPERELWYQGFHRSGLAATLLDGDADRVRAYLAHFWTHWSAPDFRLPDEHLDHLVSVYSPPGAFTASTQWYLAGQGYVTAALAEQPPAARDRLAAPTEILWQEHDPLFPRTWADQIEAFCSDARVHLLNGVGHFTPVEAPGAFAHWVGHAVQRHLTEHQP